MKMHGGLYAVVGVIAAATAASAQTAPAPVDPLTSLQDAFGSIVGTAFRAPDKIVAATVPGAPAALEAPIGGAFRTSLEIPGAAFRAVVAPLGSVTGGPAVAADAAPAPVQAAPSPPRRRAAKAHHHRQPVSNAV